VKGAATQQLAKLGDGGPLEFKRISNDVESELKDYRERASFASKMFLHGDSSQPNEFA